MHLHTHGLHGIDTAAIGHRKPGHRRRGANHIRRRDRGVVSPCGKVHGVDDYRTVNRANWDERAPAHAASPDYALARFEQDPTFLSREVRFDLPRLDDVGGLRGVHLQCHIGTDTVSLARLGARMTGLDFSPTSLEQARRLAARAGADVEFVEADVYDAADVLGRRAFDLVYTGIGALCWLPSVRQWAAVVADLLRPGGRLFLREGHPMLWSLADVASDGLLLVEFPYFERAEPTVWDDPGTYVETNVTFTHNRTYEWNHGLGEIVTALLDVGMELTGLEEHYSVPWEALRGHMDHLPDGEWRLRDRPWRLPLSYTLNAIKRS
jgi:SAM-dependent methyltransferase